MELTEHIRYEFRIQSGYINAKGPNGETNFVQPFTEKGPKLYVISDAGILLYVGKTTQSITDRLRDGISGSDRYLWSHFLKEATVDIWIVKVEDQDIETMNDDPSMKLANGSGEKQEDIVLETVEAEVAFLIRQVSGHWPKYQIEIHFHQSNDEHREAAQKIVSCYVGASCPTS